jgi:hypothetical protein
MKPTDEEKEQASWALLQAQIDLARRQGRWETPRALAMIVLAVAATFAAGGFIQRWFPTSPQTITIHFDAPIPVILEQK